MERRDAAGNAHALSCAEDNSGGNDGGRGRNRTTDRFQSPTDICNINCINQLAGAPVALNAPRCRTLHD